MTGIDWDGGVTDSDLVAIETALYEHGVLAVAAAGMRPAQHVQLARHFGELEHHEFFRNQGEGLEHITVLDSDQGDRANLWHIDEQFLERPPMVTMTPRSGCPRSEVTRRSSASTRRTTRWSPNMQHYLEGLVAVHDLAMVAEMVWQGGGCDAQRVADDIAKGRQATHPVVITHPQNGRRSIHVSPTYTRFVQGLPRLEADRAQIPLRPRAEAGVRLPPLLGARRPAHLGQPLGDAPGRLRLRRTAGDAPDLGAAARVGSAP